MRLPDAIRLERLIRGVDFFCSDSSSWTMASSDDTLYIKINTGVQFIWRCACIENDDDAIEKDKFGL